MPSAAAAIEVNAERAKGEGWGGFAAWTFVGALLGFSLLGAASIGLLVFPVALVWLVVVVRTVRVWPEVAGVLAGAAALSLLVGFANLHSRPCPARGSGGVRYRGGAGSTSSCGGLDPWPWLLVGVALGCTGAMVYGIARMRS